MKLWLKSFVHNCLVHPLIPFVEIFAPEFAENIHLKNGKWAFDEEEE